VAQAAAAGDTNRLWQTRTHPDLPEVVRAEAWRLWREHTPNP
jgi:hypothetical protein